LRTLTANRQRFGDVATMNQQTLAEMIGMTRQYVNVLLKEFRRSKQHDQRSGLRWSKPELDQARGVPTQNRAPKKLTER